MGTRIIDLVPGLIPQSIGSALYLYGAIALWHPPPLVNGNFSFPCFFLGGAHKILGGAIKY